jgi:hypothetical protein
MPSENVNFAVTSPPIGVTRLTRSQVEGLPGEFASIQLPIKLSAESGPAQSFRTTFTHKKGK